MKCCKSKKKFMNIKLHTPECKTQVDYCACGNILHSEVEKRNQICRDCI